MPGPELRLCTVRFRERTSHIGPSPTPPATHTWRVRGAGTSQRALSAPARDSVANDTSASRPPKLKMPRSPRSRNAPARERSIFFFGRAAPWPGRRSCRCTTFAVPHRRWRPMVAGPRRPMVAAPRRPMVAAPRRPKVAAPRRPMVAAPRHHVGSPVGPCRAALDTYTPLATGDRSCVWTCV